MRSLSWLIGGVIVFVAIIPGIFVRERYYLHEASQQPKIPFWQGLRTTLACRPFQLLTGAAMCYSMGTSLVSTLGFYLNAYYVNHGDLQKASVIQGLKMTAIFVPGLLSIPLWAWISEKIGKTYALGATIILGMFGNVLIIFCYTPHHPYLQILPHIFLSAFGAAVWMFVPSMQADIVDYDELRTSERREGSFASTFSWLFKMASTAVTGASGFVLVWTGFDIEKYGKAQPEPVLETMLSWYAFVPLAFWIVALVLLAFYRLDASRMASIRQQLEAKRGQV